MKRWLLTVVLLLSVGFNLGLLAAVAGGWWGGGEEPAAVAEEGTGSPAPAAIDPAEPDGGEPRERGDSEAPSAEAPAEAASGAAVDAEPPPGPPFGPGRHAGRAGLDVEAGEAPPGPPLERMADHLGLDGASRQRFLELQRRFVAQRTALQRRGSLLTAQMHRELASEDPDPAKVEELIDRRGELWRAQEQLTARTILETRSILQPEQQRRYLHILRRLGGGGLRGGPPGRRPGDRLRGEGRRFRGPGGPPADGEGAAGAQPPAEPPR